MKIIKLDKCESTTAYLKQLMEANTDEKNLLILSNFQTKGKGQGEAFWESENAKNLLLSFNINIDGLLAENQFYISIVIALSIKDILYEILPKKNVKIKWPNDVYIDDRKIAGILIENSVIGSYISESIIGIGMNVNQQIFESDAPNPISIIHYNNKSNNIDEILTMLVSALERNFELLRLLDFNTLKNRYLKALYRIGEEHAFLIDGKEYKGVIKGVDEYGFLQIEINSKLLSFDIKQIKYLY